MNQSNLSRDIATTVVEALKAKDHILVVKGGVEALVRELDLLMAPHLALIIARIAPSAVVGGEVTSTFGHEATDEAVEEMVGGIAKALMDSEHVEDVFAEDHVIRRDVFRVVSVALLHAHAHAEEEEETTGPISVRLETLGYVAATVAKRADDETLRDALERAALAAEGELASYDAGAGEATFAVPAPGPDTRLEIEEAVADELADLVDMGLVELPGLERKIELPRDVPQAERARLKPSIEAAVNKTLRRAGCAATWDFSGPRALLITITPLSEHDGRDLESRIALLSRELGGLLAESVLVAAAAPAAGADVMRRGAEALLDLVRSRDGARPPADAKAREPAPPSSKRGAAKVPPLEQQEPAPKSAAPAKKAAAAKAPTKDLAPKAVKKGSAKKAPAKKSAAKKPPVKKKAAVKKR